MESVNIVKLNLSIFSILYADNDLKLSINSENTFYGKNKSSVSYKKILQIFSFLPKRSSKSSVNYQKTLQFFISYFANVILPFIESISKICYSIILNERLSVRKKRFRENVNFTAAIQDRRLKFLMEILFTNKHSVYEVR